MRVRVDVDVPEDALTDLAHSLGWRREDPDRPWSRAERRRMIVWTTRRLVALARDRRLRVPEEPT